MLRLAPPLIAAAKQAGATVMMNDDPAIASKLGCDGVHVGQADASIAEARAAVGKQGLVGVTCHDSRHLAMVAGERGADYVAFGAVYSSATKPPKFSAPLELFTWWRELFELPSVAIGGITVDNAAPVIEAGADYLADATMGQLFDAEARATRESLLAHGRPVRTIDLEALAGWILVPGFFRDPEVAWVIWPLVALVLAGAGGIRRIDLLPTRPGLRRSAIYRHVQKGSAALRMLSHDPIAGGVGLALSVVITAGVGISVWLSARAAGVDMGLIPFLVVTPMVMLIAMIPVTISGWGLRESAMVAAFSQLGADAALILAGSVLYGLAMIIVGGVGGVLWIAERGSVGRRAPVEASSAEAASTSNPRSGA